MAITPAQITALRIIMGLTPPQLAGMLEVNERTVRSWSQGRDVPSVTAEAALFALKARHDAEVDQLVAWIDSGEPVLVERGKHWAMGVAARAFERRPDALVDWANDGDLPDHEVISWPASAATLNVDLTDLGRARFGMLRTKWAAGRAPTADEAVLLIEATEVLGVGQVTTPWRLREVNGQIVAAARAANPDED